MIRVVGGHTGPRNRKAPTQRNRRAASGWLPNEVQRGSTWRRQHRYHRTDRHGPSCTAYWTLDLVWGSNAPRSRRPTTPWLKGWLQRRCTSSRAPTIPARRSHLFLTLTARRRWARSFSILAARPRPRPRSLSRRGFTRFSTSRPRPQAWLQASTV